MTKEPIFVSPLMDVTFKKLLNIESIRNSFLRVFLDLPIISSTLLDAHLKNEPLSSIRKMFSSSSLETLTREQNTLLTQADLRQRVQDELPESFRFLKELSKNTKYLADYFEQKPRRAYADIICKTESRYVIVEAQNYQADLMSERFFAYAARVYGMQLKESDPWQDLKSVYGLVVLGERVDPWMDAASYLRHYKVLDHLDPGNVIDAIQMIEVNVNNYERDMPMPSREHATEKEVHEWMTFFKTAPQCDEEAMQHFSTPEIRQAFRAITTTALTPEEKTILSDEQSKLWGITHANHKHFLQGREEEKKTMAKMMLEGGEPQEKVSQYTGLSLEELRNI